MVRTSCLPRSKRDRSPPASSTCHPNWSSARPRHRRRRAVDEDGRSRVTPTRVTYRGGVFMIDIVIRRVGSAFSGGRIAALATTAIVFAACAAPGSSTAPSASAAATTAASAAASATAAASAAAPSSEPSASAAAAGPTCGTDPVELNAYFETGFDLPFKLSEEFTKQFPNVTWKISQDQFTN